MSASPWWKKFVAYPIENFWAILYCLLFWKPPKYEPQKWNDEGFYAEQCTCQLATETKIQCKNNCYNYACDIQTNTFAQPGRASGNPIPQYSSVNCDEVSGGAISDGLTVRNCDKPCANCCHKVALVVWPGTWPNCDYHWYRQDENGMWSHKPGKTAVRNTDNSGNPISDPRTADRGPYTQFCGCFCVYKSKVKIA